MNEPFLPMQSIADVSSEENQIFSHFSQPDFASLPIKRSKIWELKEANRCPIVGTCLSMDELVRFAQRYHFKAALNDAFLLHVEMTDCVATRNHASEAIQKHLDLKYQIFLTRFDSAKTDIEVFNLWKKCFLHGEIAGALWAALTHKRVSDETRGKIYADIHMYSHQMGAGQSADMRQLVELKKDYESIKTTMELQKQRHIRIETRLRQRLQEAISEVECSRQAQKNTAALQVRLAAIESGKTMIDMGQRLMKLTIANEQLKNAAKQAEYLEQLLQVANTQITALMHECTALTAERDALEKLLLSDGTRDSSCSSPHVIDTCQIKGFCVICVGGRTAQLSQYRSLAEQLGIRLIHHDGGQQDALSRLPEMISRADAAICPADCVNHTAYYRLKRLCKKNKKPCLLFKGKGVSGFTAVLTQLSSNQLGTHDVAVTMAKEIREEYPI